jgi:arylformamidase
VRELRSRHGALGLIARVQIGATESSVDLEHPVSLAMELSFGADAPRHFGAPAASSHPLTVPGFSGSVATGASCNCSTITLTPHCNGTHTECAGHLTVQPLDAFRIVPPGLLLAVVLSVTPERARETSDTSRPPPRAEDRLITRRSLANAWHRESRAAASARALVIRTRPNTSAEAVTTLKRTAAAAPYLSYEAMLWITEQGIEHLVVDLPSVDRVQDEGVLAAHRVFFGLPPSVHDLDQARRRECTITELAHVPQFVADGEYLLELQVPALAGDAVPSRPLLYALRAVTS